MTYQYQREPGCTKLSVLGRSPFLTPTEERAEAERARRALAAPGSEGIAAGQQSDHLLLVAAYRLWRVASSYKHGGGPKAAALVAKRHFLHTQTLEALSEMRCQLAAMLADARLVQPGGGGGYGGRGGGGGDGEGGGGGGKAAMAAAAQWLDDPAAPWNRFARDPEVALSRTPQRGGAGPPRAPAIADATWEGGGSNGRMRARDVAAARSAMEAGLLPGMDDRAANAALGLGPPLRADEREATRMQRLVPSYSRGSEVLGARVEAAYRLQAGGGGGWVEPHVSWVRELPPLSRAAAVQRRRYDLVVAPFQLGLLPTEEGRQRLVRQLWDRCGGVLVLIEPGTPSGFANVAEARQLVLGLEARKRGQLLMAAASSASSGGDVDARVAEKLQASGSHVVAPCPHDGTCPILDRHTAGRVVLGRRRNALLLTYKMVMDPLVFLLILWPPAWGGPLLRVPEAWLEADRRHGLHVLYHSVMEPSLMQLAPRHQLWAALANLLPMTLLGYHVYWGRWGLALGFGIGNAALGLALSLATDFTTRRLFVRWRSNAQPDKAE
ncbi:Methyltransferase-like protein 17, mitochondrial [Tetrabaena socialis]|uniref:Methyltransferase-like protein 17, mitochondrial n=1 Tax=Tetrabaena socialis TaxID=47790 RepID=A0A2J8A0E1_9CHLO|nr:Methyltransferase-like protein 17, mitochondrial [Tetrabaena socialis]|eukprot:PNH06003.1 Methyltransferase-like protein 17, mitochondrial [Tetrabaena socialis]